ncbi:hypothetical protein Taro_001057 [Colocasia esculenta]|uniref:Uncharacterized protein n=1 Tax=Colocasia esculenta TaxID=4460 RepID=A0A843TET2_COLES|nr:hypothetical protein [Colocasia esculenta]
MCPHRHCASNDPTFRTPARDPEGRIATHRFEDPEGYKKKGAYPENLQNTTLSSLGYKISQHSLSLLLTTHGAIAASATRPTLSSRDEEPLAEGSRGLILANKVQ